MSLFNYREKPGYFRRLKEALQVAKEDLGDQLDELFGTSKSAITEEQLEELESILISVDIGVETTMEIVERIREETRNNRFVTSDRVRRILRSEILTILRSVAAEGQELKGPPHVILVVGVNGVGKTTTIGKLVHLFSSEGKKSLLCASDTFRAAAVEQLDIWAARTGSEIVKQSSGSDPAAVLFDAVAAAKSRGKDVLLVDTAGRLHTKSNLMQELEKMKRVASREVEGAPHEVLLVLDATTGQNGLVQARQFLASVGVTGIIVTKLDGTAKGGIVVAISKDLGIPVRFVGTGEQMEDLVPFSAEGFVDSLLAIE
jgi:fused signal recognition particle receptor